MLPHITGISKLADTPKSLQLNDSICNLLGQLEIGAEQLEDKTILTASGSIHAKSPQQMSIDSCETYGNCNSPSQTVPLTPVGCSLGAAGPASHSLFPTESSPPDFFSAKRQTSPNLTEALQTIETCMKKSRRRSAALMATESSDSKTKLELKAQLQQILKQQEQLEKQRLWIQQKLGISSSALNGGRIDEVGTDSEISYDATRGAVEKLHDAEKVVQPVSRTKNSSPLQTPPCQKDGGELQMKCSRAQKNINSFSSVMELGDGACEEFRTNEKSMLSPSNHGDSHVTEPVATFGFSCNSGHCESKRKADTCDLTESQGNYLHTPESSSKMLAASPFASNNGTPESHSLPAVQDSDQTNSSGSCLLQSIYDSGTRDHPPYQSGVPTLDVNGVSSQARRIGVTPPVRSSSEALEITSLNSTDTEYSPLLLGGTFSARKLIEQTLENRLTSPDIHLVQLASGTSTGCTLTTPCSPDQVTAPCSPQKLLLANTPNSSSNCTPELYAAFKNKGGCHNFCIHW